MPGFAWWKEKASVMPRAGKYPVELLERATRLVFESGRPIAWRTPAEALNEHLAAAA